MKGIYYDGKLEYRDDIPKPVPAEGEALIKILKAGICRTDLEIAAGYMDFKGVPGHEFVGLVEDTNDKSLIGCRVVGNINCGCGECAQCTIDNNNHCLNRTVLGIKGRNGTFAEYIALPESNLYVVPEDIEDDQAVFSEPLAAAFRVAEQIKVVNVDIMVLGDGKLGLLIAQTLAYLKGQVTLVGKHPEKLELVNDPRINTLTLDELKPNRKYEVVVEATGRPEGLAIAFDRCEPRGKLILKSTITEPSSIDFNRLVVDEISIIGSRCGPFEQALAMLEHEAVNVLPLIQETFPLEEGLKAFEAAGKPGALKVLVG